MISNFSVSAGTMQSPVPVKRSSGNHARASHRLHVRITFIVLLIVGCSVAADEDPSAPKIIQSRGVDQSVDYASLVKYGPWDDRNYDLTAEDLAYLSPDEHELDIRGLAGIRPEADLELGCEARECVGPGPGAWVIGLEEKGHGLAQYPRAGST